MRQFEERASNIPALKCGAGSTILAAHQLQRIGYGVEIDPDYLAVTARTPFAARTQTDGPPACNRCGDIPKGRYGPLRRHAREAASRHQPGRSRHIDTAVRVLTHKESSMGTSLSPSKLVVPAVSRLGSI